MQIVGLDIGGANLKAASADGQAASRPLEIWRQPDRLGEQLDRLLADLPAADALAVTMTAELADCFPTKAEGVRRILDSVLQTAAGRPIVVWQTGGEFVSIADAKDLPQLVAAANWHALATFSGRLAQKGDAILIDIGSTTTDLIPIHDGMPVPWGRTDLARLASQELVYTGVERTPVCSLASQVTLENRPVVGLAAELFATTRDIYLLTGDHPEDGHCRNTADGRPATRADAARRLARMLCCDETEINDDQLADVAEQIAAIQLDRLGYALQRVIGISQDGAPLDTVLVSGSGAFLARRLVASHHDLATAKQVDLSECFSSDIATAACAFATARLAQERVADFL